MDLEAQVKELREIVLSLRGRVSGMQAQINALKKQKDIRDVPVEIPGSGEPKWHNWPSVKALLDIDVFNTPVQQQVSMVSKAIYAFSMNGLRKQLDDLFDLLLRKTPISTRVIDRAKKLSGISHDKGIEKLICLSQYMDKKTSKETNAVDDYALFKNDLGMP